MGRGFQRLWKQKYSGQKLKRFEIVRFCSIKIEKTPRLWMKVSLWFFPDNIVHRKNLVKKNIKYYLPEKDRKLRKDHILGERSV